MIVVGGASIALLSLEQAALMTISLDTRHGRRLSPRTSLRFAMRKAPGILRIATEMVGRAIILAAPFLAIGGVVYVLMLTDHDINYYLTRKPPRFWAACFLIGSALLALLAVLVRYTVSWAVAMQLHLFENVPPQLCLSLSGDRVRGHRKTIARWILTWLAAIALINSVSTWLVIRVGQWVVADSFESLWALVGAVGAVLMLWGAIHFATSLLATSSFAVMQGQVYDRFGRVTGFHQPIIPEVQTSVSFKWTRGRILSGIVVAVGVTALIGIAAIHSVELEDKVTITAHRGASGRAPENTLASVRAAIEDQADWVEIDVQESKDGVVVVAHDSDLKKVSGNDTRIWEATAAELQSIDIGSYFGTEFKDERLPTLAEVLEVCRGKVRVNIELKYYGHDQDLERKVVELIEESGMVDNVVIMSLEPAGIRKIRQLRPDWTVGLLTAVAVGDLTRSDADFLAVNAKLATRGFIRSAHASGKDVSVWTINDRIAMSLMISRGADNLITDHPALARTVLAERAEMSPVERIMVELAFALGAVPTASAEQ